MSFNLSVNAFKTGICVFKSPSQNYKIQIEVKKVVLN